MIHFQEVYNRVIKPGDYILFRPYYPKHMEGTQVGRIREDGLIDYFDTENNQFLTSMYNNYSFEVYCYLVENPDIEIIDGLTKNNSVNLFYNSHKAYDLFNRSLYLNDFVMFTDKCTLKLGISYGIMVDDSHVITESGIKKLVKCVFKITHPTKEELDIYNKILLLYNDYNNKKLLNQSVPLKPGNCYRSGSKVYIYLGNYDLNYISGLDVGNDYIDLYLLVNLKTKKSNVFLSKLRDGTLTQEDYKKYVDSSGRSNKKIDDYVYVLPTIYEFSKSRSVSEPSGIIKYGSEKSLGVYIENLDISGLKFNTKWGYIE